MQNKPTTRTIRNLARYATILLFLCSLKGFSQTYYPIATGANNNWSAGASWSTASCSGSSALSVPSTISHTVSMSCPNRTITVASNANAGALNISAGTLIINSGSTLTVTSLNMTGGTLTVNGTLNITSGGTGVVSITNGTVGGTGTVGLTAGAQNLSSSQPFYNLNIAGSGNKTMLTNITITNQLVLTTNNLVVGNNTLTVGSSSAGNGITRTNGKMTLSSGSSLSFGGSWTANDLSPFISNSFPLTINNFTMTRNLCNVGLGTAHNLIVAGAFTLTAGNFSIGNSTLTLNGAVSAGQFGEITGSTSSDLTIGGSGAASMNFDLASNATNTIRNFTNNRTSNPFIMLSSMRIGGVLSQAANASLQISNGSIQTLSLDGTVLGTSRLVGGSAAILHINGSGSLGGSLIFASSPQLMSFTMNRIGGLATIESAFSVGGMSLNFGVLTNPAGITVTGTSPSNVVQSISSSYINGPLSLTIPPNTNNGAYNWPIGAGASQKFTLNGIDTATPNNVVITAQAFDGNADGTTDATISNLNADHYWRAFVASNPGNLVSVGTVSLSDNGLQSDDAIGHSETLSGQYTSLGGSVASGAVTSLTDSPNALGYYVIGTGQSICTDPTVPTINASATTNCGTQSTTLSIATGALNSATAWNWYSGSCGGTLAGTGASISISPTSTTTYYVRGEGGCVTAGTCASVTITVNTPQTWYADADGDLYGNPAVSQLACSQPAGYVANNTDCNDADNAIHEQFSFYVDADGDGFGTGNLFAVCAIDTDTPPTGYASNNTDCDDANNAIHQMFAFYNDADGDGFGTGNLVPVCAIDANTPPSGFSINNTDCNDADDLVYQSAVLYIDADSDGYTSGATQTVCYGATIPSGYLIALTAIDCNDAVAAIHPNATEIPYNGVDDDCDGAADETGTIFTSLLPSSCGVTLASVQSLIGIQTVGGHNITGYRIRATNGAQVQIIERSVPHFTMTQFPNYAYATTYTIDIQLQRAGIWQASWGATCLVSTPPILEEGGAGTVSPSQCGITLPKISTLIASGSIQGVTGYRFRVTNLTDTTGPNVVQTIDRTQNWFSLQMLTRYNYGTTYRIEVAIKINNGSYGGYGSPCEVSSPPAPTLVNCGGSVASGTTTVAATSLSGVTQYRFHITRVSDQASTIMDRNTNWFIFNSLPASAFSPGALYYVKVAVMTTGSWSPYGDVCEIMSPGIPASRTIASDPMFRTTATPNPFTADFTVEIDSENKTPATVKVYDMIGRLIETQMVIDFDSQALYLGNYYPSGVYNVIVQQGEEVKTLRVVKR